MATNGATGANSTSEKVFLIWGGEGWVAGHLKELLQKQGQQVFTTTVRMENREAVIAELEKIKPTHVLNCAGCTGRPNVDWCEDNKEQVIRSNVIGTLNLTDCCFLKNIHCTVFATGCMSYVVFVFLCKGHIDSHAGIYAYDAKHPPGGEGYLEADPANFGGSYYSATKSKVEEVCTLLTIWLRSI